MAGFSFCDGELFADSVSCTDIATNAGTPCYVYSSEKIIYQYQRLSSSLQKKWTGPSLPLIAFACKANSNIAVIKLLGSLGAGADVVSGGEIKRAIKAGISPDKVVFSGVGKTCKEIALAIEAKVRQINIETSGELNTVLDVARHSKIMPKVAFRYTPNVEIDAHAKYSTGENTHKFGLLEDELVDLYTHASSDGSVYPVGISVHIGCQVFDYEPFEVAFNKVADLVNKLRKKGLKVQTVDIGGGLGVPYKETQEVADTDAYASLINKIFSPLEVDVILEPGRFLVAEAGALLTKVLYVKERPEKKFIIVDAGMNDLIRPTLYESYHPIVHVKKTNYPLEKYDIVGPVCETGDYFALNRSLAKSSPGDLLAILVTGAYGSTMSGNYNSRPLIPEIMTKGDCWDIIRTRQEDNDLWSKESIPDWLL